jgi:inner membrane protein
MASAVTHAFSTLILGKSLIRQEMPRRFWMALIICSVLPDVDVISFFLGMHYGDFFGHRGFSHSLLFAFLLSLWVLNLSFPNRPPLSKPGWRLRVICFLLISAHGFLDALTDGGLGVAFFSPFETSRYFLPWTPLKVSPIGLEGLFGPYGWGIIQSEMLWVWVPAVILWVTIQVFQKIQYLRKKNTPFNLASG